MLENGLPPGRPALIVGHPGHELRVHGWMESAQPTVYVVTDGSGGNAQARIDSSTRMLKEAGCTQGTIYGVATDKQVYQAIIHQKPDCFVDLVHRLADSFETLEIDYVVGDAFEGYNPTHDLCRLMIGAAVELVALRSGKNVENYDFLLVGSPIDNCRAAVDQSVTMHLDIDQIQRKISAAQSYSEIAHEVAAFEQEFGMEGYRQESLCRVDSKAGYSENFDDGAWYERYGEQQVAAGRYQKVLRYQEHFRPLAQEIWKQTVHAYQRKSRAS